ncbi:hypothetical protein HispidOSU_002579 [Sigmodon hispidus]
MTRPRMRPAAEQRLLGNICLPKGESFESRRNEAASTLPPPLQLPRASGMLCAWAGLACREPPGHMKARRGFPERQSRLRQSRAPARSHALERGSQRKWQGHESPGGSAAQAAGPQGDLCAALRRTTGNRCWGGRHFRALSNAGETREGSPRRASGFCTPPSSPPFCKACTLRTLCACSEKLIFLSSGPTFSFSYCRPPWGLSCFSEI